MNKFLMGLVLCLMALASPVLGQARAVNPHGNLDIDCVQCHTEQSWQIDGNLSEFDHSGTGYVLEGLHSHAQCKDCHREKVFSHVGISCADCHDDFHRGRLGSSCEECHTPNGWVDRTRSQREHDVTALPLVGAHAQVDCDACHSGAVSSQYVGTPSECVFCHREDYNQSENPNHATAGFGFDCETCHTPFANTWGSGDFRHPQAFPLTGGHGSLECSACHSGGFQGNAVDCYSCHQPDFENAGDPDHVAASFPTDCAICHTTTTWDGAEFNHSATVFPLAGRHRSLDCIECHSTGYTGTPTDCYACHQSDYEGTNDPPHDSAGFPVDCAACHDAGDWESSSWDHDVLFPIYSGKHREEWNSCTDCHQVSSNYGLFECITCHEHNQSDTDRDHQDEDGYVYLSTACFDCHPRGEED